MENKKIIYTESAKVKLDMLFHDLKQDVEDYLIKNKYSIGEDQIEITASDIENVKRKIYIRQSAKSDKIRLILIIYFFAGIFLAFVGLNYKNLSEAFRYNSPDKFEWMFTLTGAVMSFFSIIFYFFKYNSFFLDKKENEQPYSDNLIDRNRERFIELINHQNKELQVKKRKNILVLSQSQDEEIFLKSFFEKMDFQFVKFRSINEQIDTTSFDLVIFNNENGTIAVDRIYRHFAEATKDTMFFYFGATRLQINELEKIKNRLAISNLRPQLYGNIIQALIYQDTLK